MAFNFSLSTHKIFCYKWQRRSSAHNLNLFNNENKWKWNGSRKDLISVHITANNPFEKHKKILPLVNLGQTNEVLQTWNIYLVFQHPCFCFGFGYHILDDCCLWYQCIFAKLRYRGLTSMSGKKSPAISFHRVTEFLPSKFVQPGDIETPGLWPSLHSFSSFFIKTNSPYQASRADANFPEKWKEFFS